MRIRPKPDPTTRSTRGLAAMLPPLSTRGKPPLPPVVGHLVASSKSLLKDPRRPSARDLGTGWPRGGRRAGQREGGHPAGGGVGPRDHGPPAGPPPGPPRGHRGLLHPPPPPPPTYSAPRNPIPSMRSLGGGGGVTDFVCGWAGGRTPSSKQRGPDRFHFAGVPETIRVRPGRPLYGTPPPIVTPPMALIPAGPRAGPSLRRKRRVARLPFFITQQAAKIDA